jgi:hypothetical protein
MPVRSVVLVNESSLPLSMDRLREVARALQIQVVRDFEPIWEQSASVAAAAGTHVPPGAWPIHVVDQSAELGVHRDEGGHPYAVVRATVDWTITASHELLEMLANPEGTRGWPTAGSSATRPRRTPTTCARIETTPSRR